MIEYELIRSKRKTVAIYIRKGAVTVKAPLKTSEKAINDFVLQKEKWIQSKLAEQNRRRSEFEDFTYCKKFLYGGNVLEVTSTSKKRIGLNGQTLLIPESYYRDGALQISGEFKAALKKFYINTAKSVLQNRLTELSGICKFAYSAFGVTNAKTKWGSCDGKNGIKLNWRLILLPRGVCDYVIIHELVHTVHHNHSRKFWNCVAEFYPNYKEAVSWLKEAGVLMDFLR